MIIHICPPVPLLLWIWSVMWQGVNWLGPAVCMCTGVCLCACLYLHTNVCVCICQHVDSVSSVGGSLCGPAHVALLQSEWLFPLFLTCALWLPIPVQPCSALSVVDRASLRSPLVTVAEVIILDSIGIQKELHGNLSTLGFTDFQLWLVSESCYCFIELGGQNEWFHANYN